MKTALRKMTEQWMQLERKTLEQRKLAAQFYDENLMKLIEEDYCKRNKDYVFEEVDYLVMSVGTSYEPLVLNIMLLKPKKMLFLYTSRSEQVLNKIVHYCGLEVHQFQKKLVDEKDPLTIYREIKASYLEWGTPDKIYIDFTGGTKAMSAAAAMAGALVNIQLIYVGTEHYLTDFRKPDPGTEELLYIDNPITVFGDLEIEKAMVLFNEHNYAGAREKLSYLKENVPEPDTRQQLEFACLLAEVYEAWDALDFITASEKMDKLNACLKRDARTHRRFLMMDYRDTLGRQGELLRCLYHIPEKFSDRKQPEILDDKDTMTALMFTMYQNASIREYQEKYDMASLLMYRLLEMIEQRRLMEYGLYASRMDYSKLDFRKIQVKEYANIEKINDNLVRIKEAVFRRSASPFLPDQVSLLEGYMLLAMGDSICQSGTGRPIDFIKKTRSMVYLRNNSIFAHGLGPVGKDNYLKFSKFVTEVFQRYCGLEKIDFYKVKNDISFLNPMESKYYSSSVSLLYRKEFAAMPVIYIREQGTMLCKRGERLVVTKNNRMLLDQPLIGVDGVSVFGNVQISTQAAVMLMERGIDVSMFSYSGKYLGHLVSDKSKNIFLRMTQYAVYQDEEKRLQIAREIVRNKIDNQISVIRQYRFRDTFPWKEDVALLVDYRDRLDQQKTTNEILGIEGICSNVYFHSYGAMFKSNIRFEKRSRRPPKDPANVILSLAYTLLTKEVSGVLDAESFEPYLGFLHGVRYGRKSLALDIVEEFRQPVVDRLVLKVFNKRILSEYDFEYDEDDQIVLSEEGFRRFCMAYEKWITGRDVTSGDRSFRSRIRQQSAHLKSSLLNGQIYKSYKWKQSDVSDQL